MANLLNMFADGKENTYPPDHQFGMRVPKGGSNCQKCEYRNGQTCSNKYFNKAVGKKIPAPVDEYCCDAYEPKKGLMK